MIAMLAALGLVIVLTWRRQRLTRRDAVVLLAGYGLFIVVALAA